MPPMGGSYVSTQNEIKERGPLPRNEILKVRKGSAPEAEQAELHRLLEVPAE